MTRFEPETRISTKEALEYFEELVKKQKPIARRWRLRERGEEKLPAFFPDAKAAAYEVKYQFRRVACGLSHGMPFTYSKFESN